MTNQQTPATPAALAPLLDKLAAINEAMAPAPWNEGALYSAIRHVQRNTDVMEESLSGEPAGAHQGLPGRYDGSSLAELRNLLPEIIAALRTPAPDGWLPIESAPRDGTAIWLLADGVAVIGYCDAANWLNKVDRWMAKAGVNRRSEDDRARGIPDDIFGAYAFVEPTHWQPLPAPPSKPATGGE